MGSIWSKRKCNCGFSLWKFLNKLVYLTFNCQPESSY